MLTAYVVIGILVSFFTIYCVWQTRNIDGADIFIALSIFGIIWPVGVTQMFFVILIDGLNRLRSEV